MHSRYQCCTHLSFKTIQLCTSVEHVRTVKNLFIFFLFCKTGKANTIMLSSRVLFSTRLSRTIHGNFSIMMVMKRAVPRLHN